LQHSQGAFTDAFIPALQSADEIQEELREVVIVVVQSQPSQPPLRFRYRFFPIAEQRRLPIPRRRRDQGDGAADSAVDDFDQARTVHPSHADGGHLEFGGNERQRHDGGFFLKYGRIGGFSGL
jgi:hypothetical protein